MSCRTCWEQARSGSAAATNHGSTVFGSTSHARRAADAQAFSAAREHAYNEPNGGAFAMDEGAEGLETRATTDDSQQLPPGTALGMAIGAEMPTAHPATREGQSGFGQTWCPVSTWRLRPRVEGSRGGGAAGAVTRAAGGACAPATHWEV